MNVNIESLSSLFGESIPSSELRPSDIEYIKECVSPPQPIELVDRIDDILGGAPPKAIDSNPLIAEIIAPIKDQLPVDVLEAPSDPEQVKQITDLIVNTKELSYETWKGLSLEQRVDVFNRLESQIAKIEHRPSCLVEAKSLGPVTIINGKIQACFGQLERSLFGDDLISINEEALGSNAPSMYKSILNTLIHEGRHSYQQCNLRDRVIHASQGDVTNWHDNMHKYGYQDCQRFGFKAYYLQPVEADARKFAEDVISNLTKTYA